MRTSSREILKVVNLKQVARIATYFRREANVRASSLIALPNGTTYSRDVSGVSRNFDTCSAGGCSNYPTPPAESLRA